jgi:hypothetical protein
MSVACIWVNFIAISCQKVVVRLVFAAFIGAFVGAVVHEDIAATGVVKPADYRVSVLVHFRRPGTGTCKVKAIWARGMISERCWSTCQHH